MVGIQLHRGDITTARVDAIVNAANPAMLGGGGVDGAIHRAAGPALLAACKDIPVVNGLRCPTGEARITSAGNLSAKFVIHTVGPVYAREAKPADLLSKAYRNSLLLAQQMRCKSIAFPAISCGIYGYPLAEAAQIAIDTCSAAAFNSIDIHFYLFDDTAFSAWGNALTLARR